MFGKAEAAAVFRANDSGGDRGLQTKRTTDGKNPVADLHAVRIAKLGNGKFLVQINLDNGQIRVVVGADNLRGVACGVVVELDLNFRGVFDDVIVGENVASLINDDAGAEAAFRLRRSVLTAVEEAIEEVLHGVVVLTGISRMSGFLAAGLRSRTSW